MTEKALKELLLAEESRIIRETHLWCGENRLEFNKEYNKLVRSAIRKFYIQTIYPHLRQLNNNAPSRYDK